MKKAITLLLALMVQTSFAYADNSEKICKTLSGKYELIVDSSRAYVLENFSVPVIFINKDMTQELSQRKFEINVANSDGDSLSANVRRLTARVHITKKDGSKIAFTAFCF